LAILFPDIQVYLVERDERKLEFLKHIKFILKLENVKTHKALSEFGGEKIDAFISRGVEPEEVLKNSIELSEKPSRYYYFSSKIMLNCKGERIENVGVYKIESENTRERFILCIYL
jgi:16S rRNA G527 N7-methylase RsmG